MLRKNISLNSSLSRQVQWAISSSTTRMETSKVARSMHIKMKWIDCQSLSLTCVALHKRASFFYQRRYPDCARVARETEVMLCYDLDIFLAGACHSEVNNTVREDRNKLLTSRPLRRDFRRLPRPCPSLPSSSISCPKISCAPTRPVRHI